MEVEGEGAWESGGKARVTSMEAEGKRRAGIHPIVHVTCSFASDDEREFNAPPRRAPRILPASRLPGRGTPPVEACCDRGVTHVPPRSNSGPRLVEGESFSSEDDEDRRYPDSIRAKMRRIHREALSAGDDDQVDDALTKRFRALRMEPASAASAPSAASPGDEDDAVAACVQGVSALSLRGASVKGFPCPHCGHVFAQKKTREMHKKVCRA